VNYLNVFGGVAGSFPYIAPQGSDTNVGLNLTSKGSGAFAFYSNNFGSINFAVAHTASAVNYLQVQGQAAGGAPFLSAQGSDTNINILHLAKGSGGHVFTSGNVGNTQFVVSGTTTNDYLVLNASTGKADLYSTGSSAAVNMRYITRSSGVHQFFTGTYGSGVQQFQIAHTASAVNYLQVTGATTAQDPKISAQGSDANINLVYDAKGSNGHIFRTNGGAQNQFIVGHTASAVNFILATGSATGNATSISAAGSDTNIDLALTPKGTGVVRFGTLTATSDVAITGYIEVKDSAGNVRKLAVIT
jgi:hypothetical protein